jgi:Fungal specific transcription factor domain/Fungal Zn(2)-Cys(6) binuclear cluster domain
LRHNINRQPLSAFAGLKMVGVAGKSKGCSTCRRRKKGCDLARPSCGQCLKRGDVCGGYQRDLTFIHHRVPGKDGQSSPVRKASLDLDTGQSVDHTPSTAASEEGSPWASFELGKSSIASADRVSRESSVLVQQRDSPSSSLQLLSPSFSLSAFTSLHTSLFFSFYLPRKSFEISKIGPLGHPANWTQFIPPLLKNDASLQFAYLALTSSRIGHDNQDDNLLAAGKKFYGKALRELQRALADPKRRHMEETLLTCSSLSLYEVFEAKTSTAVRASPTPNGWLSHAAGLSRLLEARGAESYTTDKGHAIFLYSRVLITIRASTARKACFLSEPQWLTVPWRNHPKNLQHKFIDIMVFLPVIMETYDNLESNISLDGDQRHSERRSLLAMCTRASEQLQTWYCQLCADTGGRPLWNISTSDDPSYPFPLLFSFDELILGYTIMFYWTCSMLIHGTMRKLQSLLYKNFTGFGNEESLPDYINPELYALNIAQSMPYFLHPDMGALGPNLVLFPLGMAFGFFAAPTRPHFVANYDDLGSVGSMVDVLMNGEISILDKSTTGILLWFINLFTELSARHMPGGDFLLGLMEAVGSTPSNSVSHSVSEV